MQNEGRTFSVTENIVPPEGCVIFFNDDYTTKDFVVDVLVSVFHKSESEARKMMQAVHTKGKAEIGVYAYDIAVTLAAIATQRARNEGFPLMIEVKEK